MDKKTQRLYEFDKFRLDLRQKCLWRDAELVSLTPKAFDTLVVLIENRGNPVDKDTLLNKVWADTFVEESTLAQNISTLRKTLALQENGKQFIETVPRRGYRFVADVREIVDDEEIFVVETRTRTQIFAEQEIHNSSSSPATSDLQKAASTSAGASFLTANKLSLSTGILVVAIILGGLFAGNRYFNNSKPQFEENFRQFQISKLTSNGNVYKIALSPDGKYVALVEKKGEFQTLYLRQTNNANTVEIIPPTKDNFIGITFSPDNEFIYYSVYHPVEGSQPFNIGVLYKVPLLGGTRTEVLKDIDSSVTISPDKKKYAFIRQNPSERESALMLFDCEGNGGETKLTTRKFGERFTETGAAWSPDGSNIAAVAFNNKDKAKPVDIIITDTKNGQQTSITPNSWQWIGKISWLSDGSGLVFSAFGENSPNMTDEIWLASYPDGKARQVTNGINGFFGLDITSDSKSLITVKSDRVTSLWVSPIDKSAQPVMINKSIGDNSLLKLGINWTADGRIIYSTAQGGNADIWMMNPDGTNPKQLTNETSADFSPVAAPDGKFLIFISNRSGTTNVWRMNMDGTNQKQLSDFKYSFSPSIAPDAQWIYFAASATNTNDTFLWKIPSGGGEPVQLTELPVRSPKLSPDGKFIVCHFPEKTEASNQSKKLKITILSAADGKLIKQFDGPNEEREIMLAWMPDNKAVSYVTTKNNISNIWIQPIDGTPAQKLLDAQTDEIFRYGWSNDNKNLVFEKGMTVDDIVIIRDASVLAPNKQ